MIKEELVAHNYIVRETHPSEIDKSSTFTTSYYICPKCKVKTDLCSSVETVCDCGLKLNLSGNVLECTLYEKGDFNNG